MTITYEDYKTKFLIVSAKRQDSGTYVIKAQNKNGVDEADVGMLVVGPPTPPVGPLKIEDVFEDRCKVGGRWTAVASAVQQVLDDLTLADMLGNAPLNHGRSASEGQPISSAH